MIDRTMPKGTKMSDANKTCPECGGNGHVHGDTNKDYWKWCPACHGTGKAPDNTEQSANEADDERI